MFRQPRLCFLTALRSQRSGWELLHCAAVSALFFHLCTVVANLCLSLSSPRPGITGFSTIHGSRQPLEGLECFPPQIKGNHF